MRFWRSGAVSLLAVVCVCVSIRGFTSAAERAAKRPVDQMEEAARKVYEAIEGDRTRGREVATEELYTWSRRWLEASGDAARTAAEKRVAAQAHRQRMHLGLERARKMAEAGRMVPVEVARHEFFVAEADYWLERMEGGR